MTGAIADYDQALQIDPQNDESCHSRGAIRGASGDKQGASLSGEVKSTGVEVMLAQLDVGSSPKAMRLPHYRLYALKGKWKGYWSVTVKANWRIIFRFEDEDVYDAELIDYHSLKGGQPCR